MSFNSIVNTLIVLIVLGIFFDIIFVVFSYHNIAVVDSQCSIKCEVCKAQWPKLDYLTRYLPFPSENIPQCKEDSDLAGKICLQKTCKVVNLQCQSSGESVQDCIDCVQNHAGITDIINANNSSAVEINSLLEQLKKECMAK